MPEWYTYGRVRVESPPDAGDTLVCHCLDVETSLVSVVEDFVQEVYSLGKGWVDNVVIRVLWLVGTEADLPEAFDVVSDVGVLVHLPALEVGGV